MENNLKDKRILITGGAGFIGSCIVDLLLGEDVKEIVIIDNLIFVGPRREEQNYIINSVKEILTVGA